MTPLKQVKSHIWPRDEHDWYIEPAWCSKRLFGVETFEGSIYDPACGRGTILRSAIDALPGRIVFGTDIVHRDVMCMEEVDFLGDRDFPTADNIVSNPPYRRSREFVNRALEAARFKVAMLMPALWVLGDERSRWLEKTPLSKVYFLTPRPSMPPGEAILAGAVPMGGTTDFAWFVWEHGYDEVPIVRWLRRES
jgi:hypothetical protein